MTQWSTLTPDGRTLYVRREKDTWIARCNDGEEARNELLDIAMIEAIREDATVVGHSPQPEYGAWVRARADQIERELPGDAPSPSSTRRSFGHRPKR